MKGTLEHLLCRHPLAYLRLLRVTGRGSIEKRAFLALIRRGDVVFDIGANRGHFTRLFSRMVGREGAVHAFEPAPHTFETLRESFSSGGYPPNVTFNLCALGEASGKTRIIIPGGDDGQASLRVHTGGSWTAAAPTQSDACNVVTLDDYAAGLERVDFMKCDIEGAELPAIRGGRATLTRLKPMLWIEVNPEWTRDFGYCALDLLNELRALGYDTFLSEREHLSPLRDTDFCGTDNVLCAIDELHAPRLTALTGI